MQDDSLLPFELPAVRRRKLSLAFDGGRLSSDAGVLLLRQVERRLGLAERLAGCLRDRRDPLRIEHPLTEMLRLRMLAIAAGYEDADDCDALRHDPAFKLAVGRLPESDPPLCSQPTMSRLENAPSRLEIARLMAAMVDLFCASWARPPGSIVLDIDDTLDRVHGQQQLSLFNAHHNERCFLPIHIYEATSGKPVAAILRPGKTPGGTEVRTVVRHVVRRIRRHWPEVGILLRGDSHYARPEAMDWCEANRVDYVLGLAGNAVLHARVRDAADDLCVRRAQGLSSGAGGSDKHRTWSEFRYAAKSWARQRRVVARLEASALGLDVRYVVTTLAEPAEPLYETTYCGRGQAENLIKLHKTQLASDRTSCQNPRANQFRLVLHTAAYWLMHGLRAAIPKASAFAKAEFATLRLRLIKLAARVVETASRIRVRLPSACPDKALFRQIAIHLAAQPP
jgi:hypothetical protein